MLFLRNLLKLPSPVDLGWSKYNALQDRDFTPNCDGYTWRDWSVEVKKLHPIKYFIAETAADWFRYKIWLPIWWPIKDAHYWFISHFVPSRRYHFLDLRRPCYKNETYNIDCYRYGWKDVPEKMLYAMFNLLGEFLTKENPHDLTRWYSREEINADEGFKAQQDAIDEARAIFYWWTVERKNDLLYRNTVLSIWSAANKSNSPSKENMWKLLKELDQKFEDKTDEMILRLMKIRRSLWS